MAAVTGLPLRTLDSYAKRVRSRWQDEAQTDSRDARSRALDRLMALREHLFEARAWGPLVRIEQLLCELEGVRGGAAEEPRDGASLVSARARVLSRDSMHERIPLLIQASLRLAQRERDDRLDQALRPVLLAGTADLERRQAVALGDGAQS